METDDQKKDRLQKLGEQPMEGYNITHTTMKLRPQQEKTADVVTTSSEALANVDTTTAGVMPEVANMSSEPLAEATTSSNASAEEEPTTKNTPSVLLLYRIGEAIQAAMRTHDSILTLKRVGPGLAYNEAKVNGGIASLVQWVQSINQDENMLDFEGAMDWLERESKKGNSLVIDLTKPGKDGTSSNDSSACSERDSDDSDYKEGVEDAKPRHKKRTSHNKQKTPDNDDSPHNKNANLNILSHVCGDIIGEESNDDIDEISVNEDDESHTIFPADLFNAFLDPHKSRPHGRSQDNDELKDEGGQDGQPHQDDSGGLEETQESEQSLQSPREGDQDDILQSKGMVGDEQPDQDGHGGLEVRQESQQLDSPDKRGEETLSKSQRKRWRKKEREREKRKREHEEEQESGHASNRFNQEEDTNIGLDSAEEVDKRRKKK
jgi:hypothetical protein